jgi:general secretion pathway protein K
VDESFVINVNNARAGLVFGPLPINSRGGHLWAGGLSPLSLLTFFAAAKKVSAAPHRGEANRPIRMQGKANTIIKPPNQKSRKAEKQKNRKTEKQKNRKTEKQKNRKTEKQKNRKSENQKSRMTTTKIKKS